ncbi:hypothetical protein MPTK1_6g09860 [Marchantia polymorpha subsp. ruderalis]|uniref:Uncharacterized protein n=2 Tax=Marchantia polymorpha TaxID=3197 RepID=A0AAF6BQD9_MARPO|nr:hypothetical protein MARPO_0016s0030 [Marchantia polymorpha]BBN14223.1 hypothetical protein Mp_6g09860 [Marchantia polymorpha subsp. ruderalis]|eukprot:PTQ44958.1 hypothetical protein MARPO_0016s0030 [Marchantia polymorpha]
MGDAHSCLRDTDSSCVDMAKQGRVAELDWDEQDKHQSDLIDLDKADNNYLNYEGSQREGPRDTSTTDVKGKKPQQTDIVPRRRPRGVADESFPKPKVLSHTARRERLEELKRLNQQLKSIPRNPTPAAKSEPAKTTAVHGELIKPFEGNHGPSLLELEVQALARLGFVKLEPDIIVDPGPSKQKTPSDVEPLDIRRAGPAIMKPQKEPEREDLLELEKVALQNMKREMKALASLPPVKAESDILEGQRVARASLKRALQPEVAPQALPSTSKPQEIAHNDPLETQKKAAPRVKCLLHPSATPDPSSSDSLEQQKKTAPRVKCILHPANTPGPPPSQEIAKGNVLDVQKKAQPRLKWLLNPPITSSKAPLPHPSQDSAKSSGVEEAQKMAEPKGRCKLHPQGGGSKPPLAPPAEGTPKRDLLELDKKPQEKKFCVLHSSTGPSKPSPSRTEESREAAKNAPLEPAKSDLLELQKAALASMKGSSSLSPSQSAVAPLAAPASSDRGDLLELEKVALANMKETSISPPSKSDRPPNASPSTTERGDLLELEKVALASMMTSAEPSPAGSQPATKRSVEPERSDLLELERLALANMVLANKQGGQGDLKVTTSMTTKEEVTSAVVTPTSSISSFQLEPASGPLETMLVELTTKEKALVAANRKVAEKDQLLHEYEGELSKALKMLESMNVRCTDAKEEIARALCEAKGVYDELNQAWSAVEDLESRSKDNAVCSLIVDEGCGKLLQTNSREIYQSEDEERKKWMEDFLDELQTIEAVRSEAHRDFELQIQRNEKIISELQQLGATACVDHVTEAGHAKCQDLVEQTQEPGNDSNLGAIVCEHVYETRVHSQGTNPQTRSLERTSKQLLLELRKIESTRKKNQKVFQKQMARNQHVLAQLQKLQNHYEEGRQQPTMSSEQEKQWEAETAQLNARLLDLHEALDKKTKEADELHVQSLRLQRGVLEQEQKLEKALQQHKLDLSCDTKSVTADFMGDTCDLEVYVPSSCSSTPLKTDFVGDTMDLHCCDSVRTPFPLADYVCSTCSSETTATDSCPATKGCPSSSGTADFEGDTRDLECCIFTMDFEGDTRELEKHVCSLYREDKGVQVKRDVREMKRLTEERENWEEERKALTKRLDDFEAILLTKEEKIGNLIEKLDRDESAWQEERYQLVKRCEECETSLLAKEEEVIELSTQLEMAKSSLQGFTCSDSSTVVSTSSDGMMSPMKKISRSGSHRFGQGDARELLDLRCEVLSLQECLVIKGEALKTMEKELARSYTIINELRTKLARAQESERSLQSQQSQRLEFDDLQNKNPGQRVKGKPAKKPRLLREPDQASARSNQTSELVEKLRVQSEKLAALEKERAIMSRKIEDLLAKCKFLEGTEKMYRETQDPLKAEAIMELEKELQRNVEIIQKMQSRCTDLEARAIQAESRVKQVHTGDHTVVAGPGVKDKKAWQAERQGLLAGLKYFRELTEKKDEELYQLRYDLRMKTQKQIQTPPCKSNLIIISPEQRLDVDEVVDESKCPENLQLARVHAPAANLERNENQCCDGDDSSHTLQIRELTQHLRDQWELQCVMEDRLDAMMEYVSERVKEFEQNRNISSPTTNFTQFHEEASLMKVQLEQQLQVLRGTLSTSFHKLDEAKRQLQVALKEGALFMQENTEKEVRCSAGSETEKSGDDAGDKQTKTQTLQLLTERVALEDSAQTLQEKTSRLLHRLTSTRLHWNMNMLAASMAAG